MPRRIFVLYPQNKIRLNVGSIRLAYALVRCQILGAYLRWPPGGASVDFHVEYANELDTAIHKRTSAQHIFLRCLRKAFIWRNVTPAL